MNFPKKVQITETVTRDGWQSYKKPIPTELKIQLSKRIIDCGAKRLDLISFPNPKFIPQFADAEEVIPVMLEYAKARGVKLFIGSGQKHRWQNAIDRGWFDPEVVCISAGVCASERHSMENFHRTVEQGIENSRVKAEEAHKLGLELIGPIVCAFGGPYGEQIPTEKIVEYARVVKENDVDYISLADTAGCSNPQHTREVIQAVKTVFPAEKINVHLHDVQGFGLANAFIALEEGVASFDTALAGMGGCPFIKEAKGNIATEDFVNLCDGLGIETGMTVEGCVNLANEIGQAIGFQPVSYMAAGYACEQN